MDGGGQGLTLLGRSAKQISFMKRRNGLEYACANKLLVGFKLCYILLVVVRLQAKARYVLLARSATYL